MRRIFSTCCVFMVLCVWCRYGCITSDCSALERSTRAFAMKSVGIDAINDSILLDALHLYGVAHPQIVLSQAKLETGNYKSRACRKQNNLFGLSRGGRLMEFAHWTESVEAYRDIIQRRYKGGCYYKFLDRIGYAEDKNYTDKLKKI